MNSFTSLSPRQLRQAADIQERIIRLNDELEQLLGGADETPAPLLQAPRKRHKMSAAGRAAIAAAARARWAKIKGTVALAKPDWRPKRKISAAGKKRLSALAKARWAKVKAAGKTGL